MTSIVAPAASNVLPSATSAHASAGGLLHRAWTRFVHARMCEAISRIPERSLRDAGLDRGELLQNARTQSGL